jgi:hypothetical protein
MKLEDYPDAGLYLTSDDGVRLDLTNGRIQAEAHRCLNDVTVLSPALKAAAEYAPCPVCPARRTARLCHALAATLPFLQTVDRFDSHSRVTAVFRPSQCNVLEVTECDIQCALQAVTILSMTDYCEVGLKYARFFEGVSPLLSAQHLASQVMRNVYWHCQGNLETLQSEMGRFERELRVTINCQIKRLRLVCKKDAFINAFVRTMTFIDLMVYQDLEDVLSTIQPARLPAPAGIQI